METHLESYQTSLATARPIENFDTLKIVRNVPTRGNSTGKGDLCSCRYLCLESLCQVLPVRELLVGMYTKELESIFLLARTETFFIPKGKRVSIVCYLYRCTRSVAKGVSRMVIKRQAAGAKTRC